MNRIQAGQRLLESDLSEVLHVSRAPVREALRILERERLGLAADPGLAAFVSEQLNLAWCRQPVFHAKAWHSLKLTHVVRD